MSIHFMLTVLLGLSIIKAALIVAYFMHLKFERLSLILTIVPMLVVCIMLLFVFFPDSFRSAGLRYQFKEQPPVAPPPLRSRNEIDLAASFGFESCSRRRCVCWRVLMPTRNVRCAAPLTSANNRGLFATSISACWYCWCRRSRSSVRSSSC